MRTCLRMRRSVTDIICHIYTHREIRVHNHEPRAKALGNYYISFRISNTNYDVLSTCPLFFYAHSEYQAFPPHLEHLFCVCTWRNSCSLAIAQFPRSLMLVVLHGKLRDQENMTKPREVVYGTFHQREMVKFEFHLY